MKLRSLSLLALAFAVIAVGAWFWFSREEADPTLPPALATSPSAEPTRPLTTTGTPAPITPGATSPDPGATEPLPPSAKPAEPVRMTSAVSPGVPLVRTAPAPARPVVAGLPAVARASASRTEPQVDGRAELDGVQFMLRDFRTRLGENPVGSNAEIMRSLMGGNAVKAFLGPPPGQSLNADGELVDRWGTPYFFHQLSKSSMEVRSAGPDQRLWTPDDLVAR